MLTGGGWWPFSGTKNQASFAFLVQNGLFRGHFGYFFLRPAKLPFADHGGVKGGGGGGLRGAPFPMSPNPRQ